MKRSFLLFMFFCVSLSFATAQDTKTDIKKETQETTEQTIDEVKDGPVMFIEKNAVDYGEIVQNSEPLRKLSFKNTGSAPLIIKNARGSCGCTVPIWPKEPIMPGEESEIEIRYSTNRLGKINKTVTITTNEVENNKHVIKVLGKIYKEEDAVPSSKPNILDGEG